MRMKGFLRGSVAPWQCCLLVVTTATLQAQPTRGIHSTPAAVVTAAERSGAIALDGRLTDGAWDKATPATGFTQVAPVEGSPATQRTEVRFLYDDGAIYVGARMFDELGAGGVRSRLTRRDQVSDSDTDLVTISFDTFHDHLGRATFTLTPSGVKADALAAGGGGTDESWDPVWEGAAATDSLGWTAEFRIPFGQLRFTAAPVQTWGLQVFRFVNRLNESSQLAFWRQNEAGGASRFAHLEGLRISSSPSRLELLPYAVGRSAYVRPEDDGNPFTDPSEYALRIGGDIKYLLTSNIALDATINPDFGQVEVDPADVNLSAFETFFEEKRQFFIEGAGIFSFGNRRCFICSDVPGLSLFYSRRIGRAPQGLASGTYVDVPENSTILGAAKVTGRTGGGVSVGLLDAVTRSERARVVDLDDETGITTRLSPQVEPATNYFVGRLKKDYRDGNTTVGGILTSVLRTIDEPQLQARLSRHAEGAGADWNMAWRDREYTFLGQYAVSNVGGDAPAILRLQRSSARYFQRPDRQGSANGFFTDNLDSAATTLRGYGAFARVAKDAGTFLGDLLINVRSPGFEVNDLAFQTRADFVQLNSSWGVQLTEPTRFYRELSAGMGAQRQFNFDGDITGRILHAKGDVELRNYWGLRTFVSRSTETLDDRLLRGGPAVRRPGTTRWSLDIETDERRAVSYEVDLGRTWSEVGRGSYDAEVAVRVKPASNIAFSIGPSYGRSFNPVQYVTAQSDPTATSFYGRRYIFAALEQRELALDARLNVTLTPAMTLELFAQPFIETGIYSGYNEFLAPRQSARRVFSDVTSAGTGEDRVDAIRTGPDRIVSVENPDFNVRSLRGNAVFRWEYRPGSTLFLVWQQSREDEAPYGDFNLSRDRAALFSARPDNVFQLKVNYWLSR